jgi:hypothetical protein
VTVPEQEPDDTPAGKTKMRKIEFPQKTTKKKEGRRNVAKHRLLPRHDGLTKI